MSMGITAAFAQTVAYSGSDGDGATITVSNASKGETYKVVKLFDATVTGTTDGSIAYQGNIPDALANLFYKDSAGNIHLYRVNDSEGRAPGAEGYVDIYATELTAEQFATMKTWADSAAATASAESDGSNLEFTGLPYGYYVITSTQGATVTVDSTNPNATVVDKNTKTPTAGKKVDDKDVYIGETVTYTLEFATANWLGEGTNSKQVIKYEIADTLPNYLTSVNVTSIKIDADGNTETTNDQTALEVQQFNNKKIDIEWATLVAGSNPKQYNSLYKNGAKIIITYTAVVTSDINVGDADGNRNVVTLTPYVDKGNENPEPWDETFKDDETIKTYGAAIHKVDENGYDLAGAKFKIQGLTATGSNGQYTVTDYRPEAVGDKAAISLDDSTELVVDSEGYIYILGLPSDITLTVTETEAPAGYNKLTSTVSLTPIKMSETTTYSTRTVYYDADGKVIHEEATGGTSTEVTANYEDLKEEANVLEIENNKGAELPSTGGIGTTIFYVVGSILVVAAGVLLITKKRMSREG